jgi:thioesterase domain-containing protein
VLAYEVARALRAAGDDVPLLALLDPVLPSAVRRSLVGQLEQLKKIRATWDLGRRVTRKLLGAAGKRKAPKETPGDAADRLGRVRDIAYDNAIAAWDRNPQPYPGDAVLFRAADLSDYRGRTIASDLGWRRLVRGKLDIHELSGSHLSILQPPSVHRLAAIMRRYVLAPPPGADQIQMSGAGLVSLDSP